MPNKVKPIDANSIKERLIHYSKGVDKTGTLSRLLSLMVDGEPTIEAESVNKWISVEDRLPDKDGRYLVAMKSGDGYHISTRKFKSSEPQTWWKGNVYGYWSRNTCGVRYWQSLPEPPKGE